tara:strand:+ start:7373 stop:7813 length:441 start_codon:yes stop_codon:yes gene_type:complete
LDTQRLTWYLNRIYHYSCEEANEPVFTLREIKRALGISLFSVKKDMRFMHHFLGITLIPNHIRRPDTSKGKKKSRKTILYDIEYLPPLRPKHIVTHVNRMGVPKTEVAAARSGNDFLFRRRHKTSYKTHFVPSINIIDVEVEPSET